MVARSGLDCALGLGKEDATRAAAIAEMEGATRKTVADASLGAAADDVSSSYLSLVQARKDAGDAAGATKDAEAWASFLEAQAAAAKTPEQRAVFDSHRLSAYLELKQPERAIPMLQASELDLPGDYNPPSRLAVAYMAMQKPDEALAASNRALPKVTGPRRVQVLQDKEARALARIVVVGSVAQDDVVTLRQALCAGCHLDAAGRKLRLGGGGANTAIPLRHAGHEVALVAPVGGDDVAEWLLAKLQGAGIDVSAVVRVPGGSTRSIVLVDPGGERTIVNLHRCRETGPPTGSPRSRRTRSTCAAGTWT